MTAEQERKAEDKLIGADKPNGAYSVKQGRSRAFWHDSFIEEFALMARKLRKGQDGKPDQYTPIINRKLAKIDAAIKLLEANPQLAKDYGEQGKDVMDVLELIERKAAEIESDEMIKGAAEEVRKTLPGARLNKLIGKAKGGFVGTHGEIDDVKLFA